MNLSDFSSFIEVTTTLTFAFAAVEYAKKFSCFLADHIYNFKSRLDDKTKAVLDILDPTTIDKLQGVKFETSSSEEEVQALKVRSGKAEQELDTIKNALGQYIQHKNNSKSFSVINLFSSMMLITVLLVIGFGSSNFTASILLNSAGFTVLYILLTYYFGEKECSFSRFFNKHRYVIVIFGGYIGISVILACIACYLKWNVPTLLVDIGCVIILFFPYINIIVYVIKIHLISKSIKNKIETDFSNIFEECGSIKVERERHLSTSITAKKATVKTTNNKKVSKSKKG